MYVQIEIYLNNEYGYYKYIYFLECSFGLETDVLLLLQQQKILSQLFYY